MPPFVVREFGGIKVGLFGVLTPDTARASKAGPDVEFRDPCETAKKTIPLMRAAGAQVIVAVTHLTMSQDKELARCAPIDVIIGGHEHTLLQSLAGRTPIFKMGSDGRNLGRIDMKFGHPGAPTARLEGPVTSDIPEEPPRPRWPRNMRKRCRSNSISSAATSSPSMRARNESHAGDESGSSSRCLSSVGGSRRRADEQRFCRSNRPSDGRPTNAMFFPSAVRESHVKVEGRAFCVRRSNTV